MQKAEGRKLRYETKTPKEKTKDQQQKRSKRESPIRNYATVKEEKEERKRERETYLQWRNSRSTAQGNLEKKGSPKKMLRESLKNWSAFAL